MVVMLQQVSHTGDSFESLLGEYVVLSGFSVFFGVAIFFRT